MVGRMAAGGGHACSDLSKVAFCPDVRSSLELPRERCGIET